MQGAGQGNKQETGGKARKQGKHKASTVQRTITPLRGRKHTPQAGQHNIPHNTPKDTPHNTPHNRSLLAVARRKACKPYRDKHAAYVEEMLREEKRRIG